jgi:hypothetical protein
MKNPVSIGLAVSLSSILLSACSSEAPEKGQELNAHPTATALREISVTESGDTKTRVLQAVDNPNVVFQEVSTKRPRGVTTYSDNDCEKWAFFSAFPGYSWVNRYGLPNQTGWAYACAAFPTLCGSFAYSNAIMGVCNNYQTRLRFYFVEKGTWYGPYYVDPYVWTVTRWAGTSGTGTWAVVGDPEGPTNYELVSGTTQY